jgi:hypothetical protein
MASTHAIPASSSLSAGDFNCMVSDTYPACCANLQSQRELGDVDVALEISYSLGDEARKVIFLSPF